MFDLGNNFKVDLTKSKTPVSNVYRGNKYRISILSDTLIRFEYSEEGSFNDYPTFFALNRSFGTPKVSIIEDDSVIVIRNDNFVLEYSKEKNFVGSKLVPDQNLKVTISNTEKTWYFNHPEARNLKGSAYSLDNIDGSAVLDKGLFSLDGFTSFDDSRTPILDQNGNIISPNYKNIDTYLFIYNDNFGNGLRDYFNLTGLPLLIPRYALGVWWNKNESYNETDILNLVNNFKKHEIPISVLLLGEYARRKDKYTNTTFSFDKSIFPNPKALSAYLNKNNIYLGVNFKTDGIISVNEEMHSEFVKLYPDNSDKNIPINVYNPALMNAFLKTMVDSFLNNGVDILFIDDNNKDNCLRNFSSNYYLYKNFLTNIEKRGLILSRNFGIVPHKYSALYSGKTNISWKTLRFLPFFNATASNIGISWWSHDIGGYKGGMEDAELYMRYIQLGVYSPILRLSSESGKYYKREPWKWDPKTFNIAQDYLQLRHKLIPYLYSEATKYSRFGSPIIQPLYYKYPETYDEPLYKNEYYFGSELFISPIVTPKDSIMNRVVHRIFLPNGVWYDFKTGKKFTGGRRYVTFYKDEDYPVFAKTGAIIPLTKLDINNLNNTNPPKTLEIHVFPGRSNTYKLYEDDGYSFKYKLNQKFTTEINYYYKENDFSLSLDPIEPAYGVIPENRNYIIRFRNTKYTEGVQVFCNEINVPFKSYIDDNDFVIEFNDVPTTGKIFVYCKGNNIEIDASRVINDDLESIISDLQLSTELKELLDSIIFSDKSIKEKRIKIKKLKKKDLSTVFIKMFMKLLEYIAEV